MFDRVTPEGVLYLIALAAFFTPLFVGVAVRHWLDNRRRRA